MLMFADNMVNIFKSYDNNKYLINQTLVGCGDDYICYAYPDFRRFAITTTKRTPPSNYLTSLLAKYPLHRPEHLKCIVNL